MMLEVSFRHAFANLSLQVDFTAPAGITVLFGKSGSGKTTIVNAVAGLLRVIDAATPSQSGTFLDWRGESLPW